MARWRQPCAKTIAETTRLRRPNGGQAGRAGWRQDFSENSTSDAAIRPEPRKKVRSIGYFEYHGEDWAADAAKMAADPKTQEWWAIHNPMQAPLDCRNEGD